LDKTAASDGCPQFVRGKPIRSTRLVAIGFQAVGVVIDTTNTGGIFTGLTNISFNIGNQTSGSALATFKITSPDCATVISNYVPADAIVIPASATGNVQIILESSPDLVNWTAAEPGIYGPSASTNRFFRVRAFVN
jgi:hypothetical protein